MRAEGTEVDSCHKEEKVEVTIPHENIRSERVETVTEVNSEAKSYFISRR